MTGFTSKRQATADKLDDDDAQGYIAQFEEALQKEYRRGYDAGKASQPEQEPVALVLAERERIKAANAPEIERINTYIKKLEDAVKDEREACAQTADSMDSLQDGAIGKAIRARGNT